MNNKGLIGKTIKILYMAGEPQYTGRIGVIESIDDLGMLHGTWGGLAVSPTEDMYEVLEDEQI